MSNNTDKGFVIYGNIKNPHTFVGCAPAGLLAQIAPDPAYLDDPKIKKTTPAEQQMADDRARYQRTSVGNTAKAKNLEEYTEYQLMVHEDPLSGATRPTYLFLPIDLEIQDLGHGLGAMTVPWGTKGLVWDGDTGCGAMHAAIRENPEIANDRYEVTVHHGAHLGLDYVGQLFVDFNAKGPAVNPAQVGILNIRSPLSKICAYLEKLPFLAGRLNTTTRQLRKKDHRILTSTWLSNYVLCVARGITGVGLGKKGELSADEAAHVAQVSATWLSAIHATLGPQLEDRSCLVAGPAVFPALGALGHRLLSVSSNHLTEESAKLADDLTQVKWQRSAHWAGIAGRWDASKGTLSISGAKEAAYPVYEALTDSSSISYRAIRTK